MLEISLKNIFRAFEDYEHIQNWGRILASTSPDNDQCRFF